MGLGIERRWKTFSKLGVVESGNNMVGVGLVKGDVGDRGDTGTHTSGLITDGEIMFNSVDILQ